MSEWRDKGFVQDSDEEGSVESAVTHDLKKISPHDRQRKLVGAQKGLTALQSISVNTLPPSHNSSHVGRLAGGHGVEDIVEIEDDLDELQQEETQHIIPTQQAVFRKECGRLNQTPRPQGSSTQIVKDVYDIPSSPLTEPPPSPQLERLLDHESYTRRLSVHEPLDDEGHLTPFHDSHPEEDPELQEVNAFAVARNLRRRNPIQLHPYLIENEQYRRSFKARGLRPVFLQRDQPQFYGQEESQDAQAQNQFEESSSASEASLSSTPPTSLRHVPVVAQKLPRPLIAYDEHGFPDLDANLHRGDGNETPSLYKRRRLERVSSNTSITLSPSLTASRETLTTALVPQALPLSRSALSATSRIRSPKARLLKGPRTQKFKEPQRLSSPPLPTPAPSSEPPRMDIPMIDFDSESDPEPIIPFPAPFVHEDESDRRPVQFDRGFRSPSPDPEQVSVKELKKARKRMKGVLPASWLRLDRQAQTEKATRLVMNHVLLLSPQKMSEQRAIARKVERPSSRQRASLELPIFSAGGKGSCGHFSSFNSS